MRIIIVGCGKIGQTIVEELVAEKQDVLVLDSNPEVVKRMVDTYDVMGICGNGVSYDRLIEADTGKADLFIAVTRSDELNMLCCFAAKKLGAKYTVARIRDYEYTNQNLRFMKESLAIDMIINPELLTAEAFYNVLRLPSATKVEMFSNRRVEMTEFLVSDNSPLCGQSLIELKKKQKGAYLICAIRRGEEVFIPRGSSEILPGDRVAVIATQMEMGKLIKGLGLGSLTVRSVLIVGASKTAHYLTDLLLKSRMSVKIVEKDIEVCEDTCIKFPQATVVYGDGANREILDEEGLRGTDALVSLTGKDEENLLMAYYAKTLQVPKIAAKVNRDGLFPMAEKLGIESVFSPGKIVANGVLRYVRALENCVGSTMETLYKIMDEDAEAVEFEVKSDFKKIGVPLKEMKIKKGMLIASILRGYDAIIPGGEDTIEVGDRFIVVSTSKHLVEINDILD